MCVCACVRVPVCVCVCNSLGYQTWWKNFSRNYPRSTHATRWVRTKNLLLSLSLSWQTEATTLAELDYCFAPAATCSTSCSFCLPVCLSVCFAVQITFPNKHLHYAESSHGKPSVYVGRIFNQFVDAAFLIPAAPAVAAFTATFVVCRLFLGFCVFWPQLQLQIAHNARFKRLFSMCRRLNAFAGAWLEEAGLQLSTLWTGFSWKY